MQQENTPAYSEKKETPEGIATCRFFCTESASTAELTTVKKAAAGGLPEIGEIETFLSQPTTSVHSWQYYTVHGACYQCMASLHGAAWHKFIAVVEAQMSMSGKE